MSERKVRVWVGKTPLGRIVFESARETNKAAWIELRWAFGNASVRRLRSEGFQVVKAELREAQP